MRPVPPGQGTHVMLVNVTEDEVRFVVEGVGWSLGPGQIKYIPRKDCPPPALYYPARFVDQRGRPMDHRRLSDDDLLWMGMAARIVMRTITIGEPACAVAHADLGEDWDLPPWDIETLTEEF